MDNNQHDAMSHEINKELKLALSRTADYSDVFTKQVNKLCLDLSQSLGTDFFHDDHMDYRSAQRMILWLDRLHRPTNEASKASFEVTIFVSSKGNFFAVVCRHRNTSSNGFWNPILTNQISSTLMLCIQRMRDFLERRGYVFVNDFTLSERVEEHKTEIDNLPATVFEVLFSEID